jgi:hypothetical protein
MAQFWGSSSNSGEWETDAKEEVLVVAEPVGDSLNDLDLVTHSFEYTGGQPVASIGNKAFEMPGEVASESNQRLDAAFNCQPVPLIP